MSYINEKVDKLKNESYEDYALFTSGGNPIIWKYVCDLDEMLKELPNLRKVLLYIMREYKMVEVFYVLGCLKQILI